MVGDGAMAQQVWVILSAAERELLAAIAADRNRPRKHIERARIVLASADRTSTQHVAQRIGVSRPTVWRWQQRFAEVGVEGLLRDKTRKPGKGRVGKWRGGGRPGMSVSAPFVWRCLSGSTIAPFPLPSHRTGHADFPASGSRTRPHAFTHGTSRPSRVRRTSPKVS